MEKTRKFNPIKEYEWAYAESGSMFLSLRYVYRLYKYGKLNTL